MYCVPDTVVDPGDAVIIKTDKIPLLPELDSSGGDRQ